MIMRIEALLLAGLCFFGSAAPMFAQDAEGAAAGETSEAVKADAGVDVDKLIADYNAKETTPRTFTAEERDWIGRGLDPADVDAFRKGHASIISKDENTIFFLRDGVEETISSDPKFATRPVAPHIAPFATELEGNPFWTAKRASETAKDVDAMFDFIMWTSYIFTALIGVLMVVFCIKYRRKPGVRADQSITHNTPIEIIWSVIPTILVGIMFWGGYTTFLDMRTPPPDAMTVKVNAYQWGWNFTYPSGIESPQEFHVPANTPVEMLMTSNDVIHSFHLPSFRQKSDVLPNRYTKVWFDSGEPATYRVYCSEYCGKLHSDMYAKMVVDTPEDYAAWLVKAGNWMVNDDGTMKSALEIGELTYNRRGCKACHSIDGRAGTAPTFAGLWGLERKFADGSTRVADENYVRQSILDPYSQLVEGYGEQMTVYNPMLPEEQINGIIAYLKSLKDVPRVD
ncbi:Cytochrome c oxidase subunit 2 precursor [Planctomycetes bacterium Poly30]|uniref:Cytochrome c oxidase subunit 2 n=2 Tax=Saltatorellus ferox TaxID=2528018 RepID=A0A518EVZ0_9BACT|nr:Cytochrome c oxidase subunit 2 precursor [Planctomycetes bacterium Poly30]